MTTAEIAAFEPDPPPVPEFDALDRARQTMRATHCWKPNQQMGSRWPIGCVALEITQRCNLDCTLCYLSEHSEAVKDIPLDEVFRRIELIYRHYGPTTDVQITGGEPTLRKREELVAIVRRVRDQGMRPTLMTNGRSVTRRLLGELVRAGLVDVVFHVDTTQNITGYRTETELNFLREACVKRASGLPLSIMFNTTVHDGNFHEIPDLVRFFKRNAGRIRSVSFQVQARTGRGVHDRKTAITLDSVAAQIEKGAGTTINFASSLAGHPRCNRYGLCLEVNGTLYDALDDPGFVGRLQTATAHLVLDRSSARKTAKDFLAWLARHPGYWGALLGWFARKAWRMKADLVAGGGRINTISFFIHGFMDACALERDRVEACVFKAMTQGGPVSMCLHNAKRDAFILRPVKVDAPAGGGFWQPLTGEVTGESIPQVTNPEQYGLKRTKGRTRQKLLQQHLHQHG